ncbi:M24 family metallopeptidase [Thermosulfuriphilus sp.]
MTTIGLEELSRRLEGLKGILVKSDLELAIVRTPVNLLYFSGSIQDGHLIVSPDQDPLYLVWRVAERAQKESPLRIEVIRSFRDLPRLLKAAGFPQPRHLGLEFSLPHSQILLYQGLFPQAQIKDISQEIRILRACKSPWEIERLKKAGEQLAGTIAEVPQLLREGMTELDLAAELECRLRRQGHPGYLRMHGWNQEIHFGHILFGDSGVWPAYVNMPSGGYGPSYALPHGAGWRPLRKGEPLSIDLAGCVEGYMVDQTRLFALGYLSQKALKAYRAVEEIMASLEERLYPGESCEEIYNLALNKAEKLGVGAGFMGLGSAKVTFVGHGIGLEIDEFPFIARGSRFVLKPSMVIALEPKIHLPGVGLIGLEDTFLITETGPQRLTISPRDLQIIS